MNIRQFQAKKEAFSFSLILLVYCFLRLPSLIEPYWYGDEGIYEVIGLALTRGRILYTQIWDNKPPLLYVMYSFVHADQFLIRFLSLLFGLGAVFVFYLFAKRLFTKARIVTLATGIFALLFATPATESNIANAENFMLFFIILSGFLLYKSFDRIEPSYALKKNQLMVFLSGFILGIAFLFKIVALFDFAAFSLFIALVVVKQNITKTHILSFLKLYLPYFVGFLLPLLITAIYFLTHQAFPTFLKATFFSNVSYVGYKNYFIIPQGLLILKLSLLTVASFVLFKKRKQLSAAEIFICAWFAFSVFNIFFSQRPYTHYVLVGIASSSLIVSLILSNKQKYLRLAVITGIALYFVVTTFRPFPKIFPYYINYLQFMTNQKSLESYQSYFDSDVLRDNSIASYLKLHNAKKAGVFIWGNSAQIYTLSDTLPPGRYTVAYHINNQTALTETQNALNTKRPKYIVFLPDSPRPPLSLYNYVYKVTLGDAEIYERIY